MSRHICSLSGDGGHACHACGFKRGRESMCHERGHEPKPGSEVTKRLDGGEFTDATCRWCGCIYVSDLWRYSERLGAGRLGVLSVRRWISSRKAAHAC